MHIKLDPRVQIPLVWIVNKYHWVWHIDQWVVASSVQCRLHSKIAYFNCWLVLLGIIISLCHALRIRKHVLRDWAVRRHMNCRRAADLVIWCVWSKLVLNFGEADELERLLWNFFILYFFGESKLSQKALSVLGALHQLTFICILAVEITTADRHHYSQLLRVCNLHEAFIIQPSNRWSTVRASFDLKQWGWGSRQ